MKKIQQGFSLIELMIVVGIIGILAAIAVPAYQDYTARAQMSEAMLLLSGLKIPLVEAISTDGDEACSKDAQWYKSATTKGKYIEKIEVTNINNAVCRIDAVFKSSGVNKKLAGGRIEMQFNMYDGSWKCYAHVHEELIPPNCDNYNQ